MVQSFLGAYSISEGAPSEIEIAGHDRNDNGSFYCSALTAKVVIIFFEKHKKKGLHKSFFLLDLHTYKCTIIIFIGTYNEY